MYAGHSYSAFYRSNAACRASPRLEARTGCSALAEPVNFLTAGTSTGRLMLAVLESLAAVERDLIRSRTAEGRNRAKARGQPMRRSLSPTPHSRKRPRGGARRARRYRDWQWRRGIEPQHGCTEVLSILFPSEFLTGHFTTVEKNTCLISPPENGEAVIIFCFICSPSAQLALAQKWIEIGCCVHAYPVDTQVHNR